MKNIIKLWFSIVLNAAFLLAYCFIFKPFFETNDDMGIMTIVCGLKGVNDHHLVYMSSIIGRLLKILYMQMPGIPWYPVFQYVILFISFTTITYVILRWTDGAALWLIIPFLIVFSYQGYIRLQYTKTAGICSSAGMLLIFFALNEMAGNDTGAEKASDRNRPGEKGGTGLITGPVMWIAGVILAAIGSMIRFDQFLCQLALFAGIGICYLLKKKGSLKKRIIKCFGSAAVLLVLVAGLRIYDQSSYSSPEWQAYMEFNEARTSVLDYGVPDYDTYEAEYKKLGLDRSIYKLMRAWTYADTEKVTADTFIELAGLRPKKVVDRQFFVDFAYRMSHGIIKVNAFWVCLAAALFWLFAGVKSARHIISILTELAVAAALYLYLFYQGRFLYNRVDTCIWLGVFLTLAVLIQRPVYKTIGIIMCAAFIAAGFAASSWGDRLRFNMGKSRAEMLQRQQFFEEMHDDDEHLYLVKPDEVSYSSAYGMLDRIPFGIGDNQFALGGWTAHTPVFMDVLKKYGVDNPFRDMIGNDKVYLVDNHIELTMKYVRKWYDKNAEAVEVKEIGPWHVYTIE